MEKDTMEAELKRLRLKRRQLKGALTRFESYACDPELATVGLEMLQARKEKLVSTFKEYESVNLDILQLGESEEDVDIEAYEEKYFNCLAILNETIKDLSKGQQVVNQCISASAVKLPPVDIPYYDGKDYTLFKPFIELFTAVIHNDKSLSDVQKLFYLRKYLTGEALSVIINLPIVGESYEQALSLLRKRFENKTRLINNHINNLLDIPTMQKGTAASIRAFVSQVQQQLHALKNLDMPIDKWDMILISILKRKLDQFTNRTFNLDRDKQKLPTMDDFINFLEERAIGLEESEAQKQNQIENFKSKSFSKVSNVAATPHSNVVCRYCDGKGHSMFQCPKYKTAPIEARLTFVKENKLCETCLKSHTDRCKYKFKCKICKESHNTLLHCDEAPDEAPVSLTSSNDISACNVLLPTVKVKMHDKFGREITVRALLDSGSQASFIRSDLVKKLNLCPMTQNNNIIGIGNNSTKINQCVNINIESYKYDDIKFNLNCHVVSSITTPLPQHYINISKLDIPKHVQLSDDQFNIPSEISLLLGADIYFKSLLDGCVKITNGPVLQNTLFGYVVAGKLNANCKDINSCVNIVSNFAISDPTKLEDVIQKFWEAEKVPEAANQVSSELERAEQIFKESVSKKDNTFYVDLPLVSPIEELHLGDSFSVALQRFLVIEKKLQQNVLLLEQYKKFIEQYIELGHAKEVDVASYDVYNDPVFFLAHHAVLNEDSKTTKLRVVFDGSMKTKNKTSLNDVMLNGPVVQGELFDILILFRTYIYTLICDIQKMFRCVFVNDRHRSLMNILWRDDPSKPIACLQLQTVTYGLKSSTYLATRCLIELANQYCDKYPLAAQAMLSNTYVDDVMAGFDNIQGLYELKSQLQELLKLGNFKLHKWSSNYPLVLDDVPNSEKYFEEGEVDLNSDKVMKALGLKYNVTSDKFTFQCPRSDNDDELKTKRKVLSFIGKIFDPLGLIGPITVAAKLFMQKLWAIKIEWDTILPQDYLYEWEKFLNKLKNMDKIYVQRLINDENVQKVELIGYADASFQAFGCCLYLRILDKDGKVSTNLVCSKSRVAPLSKTLTIPQLELNAALLLAQLASRVSKLLTPRFAHEVFLYSDSQIVLAWVKLAKVRPTYINNRVKQIQLLTNKDSWHYVRSGDNPADLISRNNVEPQNLQNNTLWWHGPEYLANVEFKHGKDDVISKSDDLNFIEKEQVPERSCNVTSVELNLPLDLLEKYSDLNKLQRVVAYLYRFYNNCSKTNNKIKGPLTPIELHNSLLTIVRCVQRQYFEKEIESILTGKNVKSGIGSLHPFIDKAGVLRVGGRLQNAGLPEDKMHPAILPKGSHITALIIQREHLRLLHAGPRLVLSSLSQKFWLINGIREVKKYIRQCIRCMRFKAETAKQLMGSLPRERITASRPFQYVGIDFCGPFTMKIARIRKPLATKGYIAVYVCFCTKAIHLELVSDLTTDAFLACLNRFISRRGMPTKIFCDNAKTFKGAENQLKELCNLNNSQSHRDSVYEYCSKKYIQFMFIPSYSPEFGGLWEAGVKSVKHHLKRIVGNLCLTYEELNTVIIQIEGVLNSRPLLSDGSSTECKYLTPGHFLIGTALTTYPDINLEDISVNRIKFWKLVTKLKQDFWRVWSNDYLTQLQSRGKWKYQSDNVKVGDIVIVKNLNTAPLDWPIGRIQKVFPGKDNKVRVVEVKIGHKSFTRSVGKLCPIPLDVDKS